MGWLNTWFGISTSIFLRYLLFAGLPFLIFYVWKKKEFFHKKIIPKFPKKSKVSAEIQYSLISCLILAASFLSTFFAFQNGYGQLYLKISDRGWPYFFVSIGLIIFLHDAYFYWIHRAMHHPKLFRWFHFVHHKSVNTTPFSAFSFHPIEAIVEFAVVPLVVFLVPIHVFVLVIFGSWTMIFNVLGHCGYEFFPAGFTRHPVFRWINSSVHHNLHHTKVGCNFGLYFNFWDTWMGTNRADYHEIFEEIKLSQKSKK